MKHILLNDIKDPRALLGCVNALIDEVSNIVEAVRPQFDKYNKDKERQQARADVEAAKTAAAEAEAATTAAEVERERLAYEQAKVLLTRIEKENHAIMAARELIEKFKGDRK